MWLPEAVGGRRGLIFNGDRVEVCEDGKVLGMV